MKLNQLITMMVLVAMSGLISVLMKVCGVSLSTFLAVVAPLITIVGGYLVTCYLIEEYFYKPKEEAPRIASEEPEE